MSNERLSGSELASQAFGGDVPPTTPPPSAPAEAAGGVAEWPKPGEDGQWRDKARKIFDPQQHAANAEGHPLVSESGYFRLLPAEFRSAEPRNGEAAETASATPPQPSAGASASEPSFFEGLDRAAAASGDAEAAAQEVIAIEEMVMCGVFGEDASFTDKEKAALVKGWVAVFVKTGVPNLPWWGPAVIAHGMVLKPRMMREPVVKDTLTSWRASLGAWLRGWWGRGK